ncbi:MAG: 3-phosphoshikimate 1-carboxyvinyltransferase [Candidatus Binatia bacterium]|nr:3-phosphoshikimate 1-carboxyvinyltransferase [Candidatus Binatia bacterium]
MKRVRRLGIVGVGLLGGSLGLVAKREGLAGEVVALGRTQANLDVALKRGCVDRAGVTPDVLAGADLVVLATPIGMLASSAAAVAPHLADGAIVTDVGSSKASVVEDCTAALAGRARFVGSHPIAGMETSGAGAALADLFSGARCVLTPIESTDPEALAEVRALWIAAGMDVDEMSPDDHDRVLALTSHLPHVAAWALARAVAAMRGGEIDPLRFAGPSLRDMTRIAGASPEMWRDILVANADSVLAQIDLFRGRVDDLAAAIEKRDDQQIEAFLREAADLRTSLQAEAAPAPAPAPDDAEVVLAAGPLRGRVDLPGDKSIGHRALILGAVAEGITQISGLSSGEDNASTREVLASLGVESCREGDRVWIDGRGFEGLQAPTAPLSCGNSGTTIRMMCGVLAGRPFEATLDGDESLRKRPMDRVIEPLAALGAEFAGTNRRAPITVRGGSLRPGRFELPVASAQVKTALLLAGLQADGETIVAEPGASRDHTERLLPVFGVSVRRPDARTVCVSGPARLTAAKVAIPADPSAAAFWLVAGSIVRGSRLELRGVSMNPTRTGALDVLLSMGARIDVIERDPVGEEPVADLVVEAAPLRATEVSGETMLRAIDEFPALAVAAAVAEGSTRFADGAELRVKESDRIAAMTQGLSRLGVQVQEAADGLVVHGGSGIGGGEVETHRDHRIAMAFAVAGLVARGPVRIRQADIMAVSDPGFLRTLRRLQESES